MGIRGLNKYFKHLASSKSIRQLNINELKGKTLVVDTSIYMYKFIEDGSLLNNMFTFITQCMEYNIHLVFVFDGKPNHLKKELLLARCRRKITASNKYLQLEEEYDKHGDIMSEQEKSLIKYQMGECKKRSIRVSKDDIDKVKLLMDSLGVFYCDAPEEADVVCSYYVEKGYAWACVSDDMDMFAYGCPRVIREWNILKSHAILYDLHNITVDINIPIKNLRSVLLLLNNDYCKESIHLETAIRWYREYNNSLQTPNISFYDWLLLKKLVTSSRIDELKEINELYEMPESIVLKKNIVLTTATTRRINWIQLKKLLEPCGFVFI
jgi:flap endonuclease-1